jgi:hypothetical protein
MSQSVMLIYRGGEIKGPFSLEEVVYSQQNNSKSEVDFVIDRKKGWVPLDTYLAWAQTTGDYPKGRSSEPTVVQSVVQYFPWKLLVVLGGILSGLLAAVWWVLK